MTQAIKVFVIIPLIFTVFLGRDHDIHVLGYRFFYYFIAVIALIGKQPACGNAVNQSFSLRTIRHGTRCNKYSDWHTIRIHGKMYLAVEPPFVHSMS